MLSWPVGAGGSLSSMFNADEIAEIVNDARRGNRDAFWAIVRVYGLPLRSYLASHLHTVDDIDDLSQEVFLAAYCNLNSFREGDDFGAWLRGIARHKEMPGGRALRATGPLQLVGAAGANHSIQFRDTPAEQHLIMDGS